MGSSMSTSTAVPVDYPQSLPAAHDVLATVAFGMPANGALAIPIPQLGPATRYEVWRTHPGAIVTMHNGMNG